MRRSIRFKRSAAVAALLSGLLLANACSQQPSGSAVKSLDQGDVSKIVDNKNDESSKERLVIFIEAEQLLTDGGDKFVKEYVDLFQNHTGTNQSIYLLSDASRSTSWFSEYEMAAKGIVPNKNGLNIAYAKRTVTIESIQALVKTITDRYADRAKEKSPKRLEVFVHFLAHGLAARGSGEGFVGVNFDQYEWSELANDLLKPLSEVSDELIAVIEPCFGGSLTQHLPPLFFRKNNAMIVFGAPSWASQIAPWKEGMPGTDPESEFAMGSMFRTSIATMAVKNALLGFASEGLITDENSIDSVTNTGPEAFVTVQGKDLTMLDGEEKLKEKQVVRVNEFIPYVENKGNLMYCNFAVTERHEVIRSICENKKLTASDLGNGISVDGEDSDVRIQIPSLVKLEREDFITRLNTEILPLASVHVMSSTKPGASLNPAGRSESENGILSLADLNLVEETNERKDHSNVHKFFAMDKHGVKGLQSNLQACLSNYDSMTGDLYDVLKAVSKNAKVVKEDNKDDFKTYAEEEEEKAKLLDPVCSLYLTEDDKY